MKRSNIRKASVVAPLVCLLLLSACVDDFMAATAIEITLQTNGTWPDTLRVAEIATVLADAVTADGSTVEGVDLVWSSSDSSVLQVVRPITGDSPSDEQRLRDGRSAIITTHKAGTATIIARLDRSGLASAELSVPVVVEQADWPALLTVSNEDTVGVELANADPAVLGPVTYTWQSSDPPVLQATALSTDPARAQITARASGPVQLGLVATGTRLGAVGLQFPISVRALSVVSAAQWPTLLTVSDTATLGVQVLDALGQPMPAVPVSWQSTSAVSLSVSAGGTVTALSDGGSEVIATAGAQGFETAELRQVISVGSLQLVEQPAWPDFLPVTDTAQLVIAVQDVSGTPRPGAEVSWSSTNPSVFTVDSTGVVSALARGSGEVVVTVGAAPFQVAEYRAGFQVVEKWRTVSAGFSHTCAIAATDGTGYCWGSNSSGQLGISGGEALKTTPSAIATYLKFTELGAGGAPQVPAYLPDSHTCGRDRNTNLLCWGSRVSGQLGDGACRVFTVERCLESIASPVPIVENGQVGSSSWILQGLSVGGTLTCILDGLRGEVDPYCWGLRDQPPGSGPGIQFAERADSATVIWPKVDWVTAGGFHQCLVNSSRGELLCSGYNDFGQLGDGTTVSSNALVYPRDISGSPYIGGGVFNPSAGGMHTCAASSQIWCWGSNSRGQLGTSAPDVCSGEPCSVYAIQTQIPADPRWSVSAGYEHTCALTQAGEAWCWGSDSNGQLGRGTIGGQSETPAPVSGGFTFVSLTAGGAHTCGVIGDGSIYCWGANGSGQLGDGSLTDRTTPTRVAESP